MTPMGRLRSARAACALASRHEPSPHSNVIARTADSKRSRFGAPAVSARSSPDRATANVALGPDENQV